MYAVVVAVDKDEHYIADGLTYAQAKMIVDGLHEATVDALGTRFSAWIDER